MENNTTQIACICEHAWQQYSREDVINAETLLNEVRHKLQGSDDPNIKQSVDIWIAEFSNRTGFWKPKTKSHREVFLLGKKKYNYKQLQAK